MRVTVTITDADESSIQADVEADSAFTPECAEDLLSRCADTVLRMYAQTHAEADG